MLIVDLLLLFLVPHFSQHTKSKFGCYSHATASYYAILPRLTTYNCTKFNLPCKIYLISQFNKYMAFEKF